MIEQVNWEEKEKINSIIKGKNYILYFLSSINIGGKEKNKLSWDELDKLDELLEARFFNEEEELHIYEFEGERKVSFLLDQKEDKAIIERQYLRDNDNKEIEIKKYIEYDEYGQAYISYLRPIRLLS